METKELTCINCPMGCNLKVTIDGNDIKVFGNTCPNGEKYAINELTNPLRTVTSIVRTDKGHYVSCKTDKPVPKAKILEVVKEIRNITAKEPVKIKDILIKNVCGTDSNIVATKNI